MDLEESSQHLKIIVINQRIKEAKQGLYSEKQLEHLNQKLLDLSIKEVYQLSELTEEEKTILTQKKLESFR